MDKYNENTPSELLIYGGGGHAKVVQATARLIGYRNVAYFDDMQIIRNDVPYLGVYNADIFSQTPLHVAIGRNDIRAKIFNKVKHHLCTIIHPEAWLAENVIIGKGSFIGVKAILQTDVILGQGCIINTGSIIEHDCLMGDFVHIAPGAILCGNVTVGDRTLVGAGAKIKNNVSIGKDVVIGIGSVVLKDIPDGKTAVGIPAHVL